MNNKSQSIPITRTSKSRTEDAELKREAMIADFKDYQFYSRLVDGIQQRQNKSRSIDLRYQNQALINHLTATRNMRISSPPVDNLVMPSSCRSYSASNRIAGRAEGLLLGESSREQIVVSCVSDTLALIDDEEDLMFDMED